MDAPLVGDTYFCGTEIPSIIESTGHALFLRFKTDYHINTKGFQFEVNAGRYLQYFDQYISIYSLIKFSVQ